MILPQQRQKKNASGMAAIRSWRQQKLKKASRPRDYRHLSNKSNNYCFFLVIHHVEDARESLQVADPHRHRRRVDTL